MFIARNCLRMPTTIVLWRTANQRFFHIKRLNLYKKCFRILGVDESADQNTVRRAYIELVKKVHPDSGQPEASAERFQEVDEAFKVLQEKFAKNRRGIEEDDEEEVFDIRHTAPQHRQYLSYDGVGMGTPFQREKQYQQVKAMRAQENVLNHRLEKSKAGEKSIMKKGTFYKNHAIKTKYGFDRMVEDLIQEAMSKGDFSNLTGEGKPLATAQQQNPYLDFTTHKLNKILLDNGFTPEWITLQRDIRMAMDNLKNAIKEERIFFGDYPFGSAKEDKAWQDVLSKYDYDINELNKSIDKYNLIVPMLDKQYFRVNIKNLAEKILKDPTVPKNFPRPDSENNAPTADSSVTKQSKSDFLSLLTSFF